MAKQQLFQCAEGDWEGHLSGAMHHASLTGHSLTRETDDEGTTMTISLAPAEDEDEDYWDPEEED